MALRRGGIPADFLARLETRPQIGPTEHGAVSIPEGDEAESEAMPEGSVVGTGGIEPPTPTVSRWCSPTELRAWEGSK